MWTRVSLCRTPYYLSDSLSASLPPLNRFEKILHRSPVTVPLHFQSPSNGQLRCICCSQGGMGRKKGGLIPNKVASAPTCQDPSSGIKVASSPVQWDKTGNSTLISIAAKPGAKHSSITNMSDVRAVTVCCFSAMF